MQFKKLAPTSENAFDDVTEALQMVRHHLDMDISYLSEFRDDDIVFRAVSTLKGLELVSPGDTMPVDHAYCKRVLNGELPNLINDTRDYPLTEKIPATSQIPIRAHISVPIHRTNGDIYGMFCCLSRKPNETLNQRDLNIVTSFARLAARSLNLQLDKEQALATLRRQITNVIEHQTMKIHFQPIVSMRHGEVRAIEALSRITAPQTTQSAAGKNVEWWFEQARSAHMQVPFELNAINIALAHMNHLPPKVYLSVNVSPATLSSPRFRESLQDVPRNRLIVELTEHVEIAQTKALMDQIEWLRNRGIGLAIDDVGAGYAGLSTIIQLRPNVLKLDRSLVSDIHKDTAKQSLARAMFEFATGVNAFLIAEGVEKPEEHFALREIGTRLAQGYLYARPAPAFDQIDAINAGTAITMPQAFSTVPHAIAQNHRPRDNLIA